MYEIKYTTSAEIINNYDYILMDAFGVLIDAYGALPGAVNFIEQLKRLKKHFCVISNGALYSPLESHRRCYEKGVKMAPEQYITSGGLIPRWIEKEGYKGARFLVLGPQSIQNYVQQCGGHLVGHKDRGADLDVIVLGHQTGFDFVSGMDYALTKIMNAMENGRYLPVLIPNTDLIYPNRDHEYGITSGSMMLILKEALALRFPGMSPPFVYLGKPYPMIYQAGIDFLGCKNPSQAVMIGDQVLTDVKGANEFGMDSVLIGTGITHLDHLQPEKHGGVFPKLVLNSFEH